MDADVETVAVIGGSGFIGRAIVEDLNEHGHRTVSVDPDEDGGDADATLVADARDAGEVYGALAKADADAVIHVGTIPSPVNHPGHVTYESNAQTAFNVLEAAEALDVEAVALASSINALGWSFGEDPPEIDYVPLDEDHPARPADPYALGKRSMEVVAAGFGRRSGAPERIATLRYPWVADDDALRERIVERDRTLAGIRERWDPDAPSGDLCAYVHVDDAASVTRRAVTADYEGHETFWVSAADTSADAPTDAYLDEFHPDVERRRSFEGHEAMVSTAKAERLLDWTPDRSWRDLA